MAGVVGWFLLHSRIKGRSRDLDRRERILIGDCWIDEALSPVSKKRLLHDKRIKKSRNSRKKHNSGREEARRQGAHRNLQTKDSGPALLQGSLFTVGSTNGRDSRSRPEPVGLKKPSAFLSFMKTLFHHSCN
ncbi:hypothetical protein MRB53_007956 [Persea americana]|uniref:Uncharacterized protein n=1 Tax=Persea americana TaxID=3435 RepID=A0ACC2MKR5_PERAE|nr:hypothetical protein MRB53_007956 [Persea americana]